MEDDGTRYEDPWRAVEASRAARGEGGFTAPPGAHRDPPGPAGPNREWDPFAPGSGPWAPPPADAAVAPGHAAEGRTADWFIGTPDGRPSDGQPADGQPPGGPTDPADPIPGLPGPGSGPTWQPYDGEGAPQPGMAAPGRHGWARSPGAYVPATTDKGANLSLILGIVGLLICGVLIGPAAIAEGVKARRRIATSGGGLTGNGRAIAGICLGALATFLAALGLLATVIAAVVRT